MKDKYRYSTSQLFNFAQDSYLERTSRPIYAVIFLLPFIVLYELGTILINTDVLNQSQIRIVAFVWLQNFLEYIGSGSRLAWVAPPLVVMVILISLQVASRKRWWFSLGDFLPMTIECILLAAPLIVLSLFLNSPAQMPSSNDQIASQAVQVRLEAVPDCLLTLADSLLLANSTPVSDMKPSLMANIVTGIGAGIYEELVFRLILICLLMVLFQDVLGFTHKNAIVLSVLLSAAFFSAHHHIALVNGQLDQGSPFSWTEFGFRTIAGIYFAIVFAIRGFGITAGTHAFYDIIATIINAIFFQR